MVPKQRETESSTQALDRDALSPYVFITLLTVMMTDITDDMTQAEKRTLDRGRLNHEITYFLTPMMQSS